MNGTFTNTNVSTFTKIHHMKPVLYIALSCFFVLIGLNNLYAQSKTTTYILVRHAEKDTSKAGSTMMQSDPELSEAGKLRAENLVAAVKGYKIDAIYSTNYIRTKNTVRPLSEKNSIEVQTYDPRNLKALVAQLQTLEGKTILIAGHSNTTPALANLLLGADTYKALDESVYNKIYIITVTDGKAISEVKEY
jgi:2,3-bisphosphoglycerate-dependent phosphoglycerate mutase